MLATAMQGDEGTYDEALLLIMERNGYPEETYYTFSYSPVPDDEGGTGGIICANTDDTQRIIGERQLALLRELAARTGRGAHLAARPAQLARRGAGDRSARPAVRRASICVDPGGDVVCAGGAPASSAAMPRRRHSLSLDRRSPLAVRRGARDQRAEAVSDLAAGSAALPTGAWTGRRSTAVVLLPIAATGETGRAGVLVVGLNPFRLFDDELRGLPRSGRRPDRGRDRQRRRPTRRSGGVPRRWPSSTAPRPRSSPTSATSSARRSR